MPSAKETFTTNMNALANSINTKAGTTGAKTIEQLKLTVDNIQINKPEQTKTLALNMSAGDQVVTPDSGYVLTQVTIEKPVSLISSNIKNGITIGGVTGNLPSEDDIYGTINAQSFGG